MMFKMSDNAQTIRVFNYLDDTKEFIGSGDALYHLIPGYPQTVRILHHRKSRRFYCCI